MSRKETTSSIVSATPVHITMKMAKLPFFDPIIEYEFNVLLTCPLYEAIRAVISTTTKEVLQEQ